MTTKRMATLLVFAGLTTVLFSVLRPVCPRTPETASTTSTRADDVAQHDVRAQAVEPVQLRDGVSARALMIQRNVFAYALVSATRLEPSANVMRQPGPLPVAIATVEPKPVVPREPEFPYQYIGRFGPEQNPIAVFAGNGDVVTVRIGDSIAGQFRLSGVGIESADVLSASGAIRRLTLHP